MKPKYKIPFSSGDLMHYADWWTCKQNDFEEKEVFEFEDTLTYLGYSKGRSSILYRFKRSDENESKVHFVASMFDEIIPLLVNGKVTSKFTFRKMGGNFTCCLSK